MVNEQIKKGPAILQSQAPFKKLILLNDVGELPGERRLLMSIIRLEDYVTTWNIECEVVPSCYQIYYFRLCNIDQIAAALQVMIVMSREVTGR